MVAIVKRACVVLVLSIPEGSIHLEVQATATSRGPDRRDMFILMYTRSFSQSFCCASLTCCREKGMTVFRLLVSFFQDDFCALTRYGSRFPLLSHKRCCTRKKQAFRRLSNSRPTASLIQEKGGMSLTAETEPVAFCRRSSTCALVISQWSGRGGAGATGTGL